MVHGSLLRRLGIIGILAALFGCSPDTPSEPTIPGRWYTAQQVNLGRELFLTHCAICHGENAEATPDWRTTDDAGNYPPPPLNGSAHAWHHPLTVLERMITDGGIPLGGVMPGFGSILDSDERHATIAYFQSFWTDEIYANWLRLGAR
ncbi:MAG: c-type cytochrome [Candidatus Rariloculaceae bacterium]